MTNYHLINAVSQSAKLLNIEFNISYIEKSDIGTIQYKIDEVIEFKRDLVEMGTLAKVLFLDNGIGVDDFKDFLKSSDFPIIVFKKNDEAFLPVLIYKDKKKIKAKIIFNDSTETIDFNDKMASDLFRTGDGKILALAVFSLKSFDASNGEKNIKPLHRLINLLKDEKRDIFFIFVYAIIIGLVGLILPLGLKATVELLSSGVIFSSIYILISLVIIAIIAAGILQIMQISILEYVQRRIFTKAALEFTYRIPRIRVESILNQYAPELINRFFDVLTVQKGLPKILIDLVTATVQILFGLMLLSFYHPFFVFFGLILILFLFVIFYFTGPKGLKTSIIESKYKYKVVYWLEELARSLHAFKLSGNTNLPIRKTEYNVNNYLKNRSDHFKILISQYSFIVLFKAVVTGGLLIIGAMLLVDRQITLGQFVASEVIIILILSSVEKLILYMDVVYDVLTAADKISHITDIPLERSGGFNLSKQSNSKGFRIEVKELYYKYSDSHDYALSDINFIIDSGEKICIAGDNSSGKSTLINALTGINLDYKGLITIDSCALKDLDLTNIRDKVAQNSSEHDIFDGTILENILVGNPLGTPEMAMNAIKKIGIQDKINELPDGLNTHINPGGKGFSKSFVHKLLLARCLAKEPKLIVLKDFFRHLSKNDKFSIIDLLINKEKGFSLISVSNDPTVMAACDRVIYMRDGKIIADGKYEEIIKLGVI